MRFRARALGIAFLAVHVAPGPASWAAAQEGLTSVASFKDLLQASKASKVPLVVELSAPWCKEPCQAMHAQVLALKGVRVVTLSAPAQAGQSDLFARIGAGSIPAVVVYRDGKEAFRTAGLIGQGQIDSILAHPDVSANVIVPGPTPSSGPLDPPSVDRRAENPFTAERGSAQAFGGWNENGQPTGGAEISGDSRIVSGGLRVEGSDAGLRASGQVALDPIQPIRIAQNKNTALDLSIMPLQVAAGGTYGSIGLGDAHALASALETSLQLKSRDPNYPGSKKVDYFLSAGAGAAGGVVHDGESTGWVAGPYGVVKAGVSAPISSALRASADGQVKYLFDQTGNLKQGFSIGGDAGFTYNTSPGTQFFLQGELRHDQYQLNGGSSAAGAGTTDFYGAGFGIRGF